MTIRPPRLVIEFLPDIVDEAAVGFKERSQGPLDLEQFSFETVSL